MSNITSLLKRLSRASEKLFPRPRETRLPYLCLGNDGAALQGYEEHNVEHSQLAKRLGIPASVYVGFDPNQDGSVP